jgi:hypothetical protein
MKFSTFAEKLIKKQMEYDEPPSGIYTYKKTQGLLNRQKGLLEFLVIEIFERFQNKTLKVLCLNFH